MSIPGQNSSVPFSAEFKEYLKSAASELVDQVAPLSGTAAKVTAGATSAICGAACPQLAPTFNATSPIVNAGIDATVKASVPLAKASTDASIDLSARAVNHLTRSS